MLGWALIRFVVSGVPGLTNFEGELFIAELLIPKDFSDPEDEFYYVKSPVRDESLL